jgi:hypothetical protein
MSKAKVVSDELSAEYKRSDFKGLERGTYYERVRAHSNFVLLEPEVAAVFPNSAAVNKALRSLTEVAQARSSVPMSPRGSVSASRRLKTRASR